MNKSEYQAYLASREWAVKREAVRSRSDGYCERCWFNEMDAVHHRTYERVGEERLSDLVAICDPCHEYLSGKRRDDPATCDVPVYLAGPFTLPDWRHQLLLRCLPSPAPLLDPEDSDPPPFFPIAQRALPGGFAVTGPWRIAKRHHPHGMLDIGGHKSWTCSWNDGDSNIVRLCKRAIEISGFVFAWLPESSSPPAGTLWELGYAAGRNKPVVLARPERNADYWAAAADDYWFATAAADFLIRAECAAKAWQQLIGNDFLPGLMRAIRRPQ